MESRREAEALFHQHLVELLHEFEELRAEGRASSPNALQRFVPLTRSNSPPESISVPREDLEATALAALPTLPHELQQLYIRLADSTGKMPWSTLRAILEWKGVMDTHVYQDGVRLLEQQVCKQKGQGQGTLPRVDGACAELLGYPVFVELMSGDVSKELLKLRQILDEEAKTANFSKSKEEKTGKTWWQHLEDIPQGFLLEIVPAFVIMVNAVVIGISLDSNPNAMHWQVLEWFFTALFTVEALARMHLLGCSKYFTGADAGWNYFDLICLACAYTDIIVTATFESMAGDEASGLEGIMLIKVLRLGRVCRLIRVMRFGAVRELRVIILGVLSGVRVLFWAIALLFFTVYIIGVSAHMILTEDPNFPEFSGVRDAMFTTFRCVTDGCSDRIGAPLHEHLRMKFGDVVIVIYMVVYLIVVIGIFNLIMAVFLDSVVNDHQARELQELGEKSHEMEKHITHVIATLASGERVKSNRPKTFCQWIGGLCRRRASLSFAASAVHRHMNQEVVVARADFNKWLEYPEMIDMLAQCKIETATKHDLFDVLDAEMADELHFNELVDGLMRLRGSITKVDVIALRLKMRHLVRLVQQNEGRKT